jgi:Domain of unknown function (DUF4190)
MSYSAPPPPPEGYGQPQGGMPPPAGSNSKALWSLILGVVSLICCGILTGPVAIVLGRQAEIEIARTGQQGAGMAKAGFILGIIGTVLSLLTIVAFTSGIFTVN